jgi:hypothetical protein
MQPVYYKYLDLPKFDPVYGLDPGHLSFDNNVFPTRPRPQPNGEVLYDCRYVRYTLDARYQQYIESLVPELKGHIRDIGIQRAFNETQWPAGTQLVPHTDGQDRGQHCLNYIFETGGDAVATTWWQEPNHPLVREPRITIKDTRLVKVTQVVFAASRWVTFRTDIIHSVQPIHNSRVALSIGFTNEAVFDTIMKRYGETE